jgi:hypothetical protein
VARKFANLLDAFCDYASYGEAPKRFYRWVGISMIAGALRRRVWIDQKRFYWYPNFFIILVAPPGVATKSTTADIGMNILALVPGIKFGPNNITWQQIATSFANAKEEFPYKEEYWPMSAITLKARELGSLLNPKDPDLINLMIELWDGAPKYEKETKMSGNDLIICPWINIIGCTTPGWISDNIPVSALRGGFISRCVFLYAMEKEKEVAYVDESIPFDEELVKAALASDLTHIAEFAGPFTISKEAREWGRDWYHKLWGAAKMHYSDDQVMGFVSRKQTHMHKLAMVLSAARQDTMTIDLEDLVTADVWINDIEGDMNKVFASVGKSEAAVQAERLLKYIQRREKVPYEDAYRFIHAYFPDAQDFEGIVTGLIRSGQVTLDTSGTPTLVAKDG